MWVNNYIDIHYGSDAEDCWCYSRLKQKATQVIYS